jgi:hypothetical protein
MGYCSARYTFRASGRQKFRGTDPASKRRTRWPDRNPGYWLCPGCAARHAGLGIGQRKALQPACDLLCLLRCRQRDATGFGGSLMCDPPGTDRSRLGSDTGGRWVNGTGRVDARLVVESAQRDKPWPAPCIVPMVVASGSGWPGAGCNRGSGIRSRLRRSQGGEEPGRAGAEPLAGVAKQAGGTVLFQPRCASMTCCRGSLRWNTGQCRREGSRRPFRSRHGGSYRSLLSQR